MTVDSIMPIVWQAAEDGTDGTLPAEEGYVPGDIYDTLNNDVFNVVIVFIGALIGTGVAGLTFYVW